MVSFTISISMFLFMSWFSNVFMCLSNSQGPEGAASPDRPCPHPRASPTFPQPRTPCQPPRATAKPQQGWSPAPHTMPCPATVPAEPGPPMGLRPILASACPGLGLPQCPPAALLLAGAVGQPLAARPCPDGPREAPDGQAPGPRSLPAPAVPCSF